MKQILLLAMSLFSAGLILTDQAFARPDDLSFYKGIQSKKSLTSLEEARRIRLLNDARFLRTLKVVLNKTPVTADEALEQNTAIDLLQEAVRSGDSDSAIEVLRSVVMDEHEDPELQARSVQEEREGALIPAPVRGKTWGNVIRAQPIGRSPASVVGP